MHHATHHALPSPCTTVHRRSTRTLSLARPTVSSAHLRVPRCTHTAHCTRYAPRVAIVSLGAACTFEFVTDDAARDVRSPAAPAAPAARAAPAAPLTTDMLLTTHDLLTTFCDQVRASLLLPPRGVLVFAGEAYEGLMHTMHVPAHAAVSDAATDTEVGRPDLIRLDALPPAHAPTPPAALPLPAPRSRRVSLTVRRVICVPDDAARCTQGGE